MKTRSPARVPRSVFALLAGALLAHLVIRASAGPSHPSPPILRPPPSRMFLQVASAGDPAVMARGLMLWLQTFDYRGGVSFPLRALDYGALTEWLDRIQSLEPRSEYPLRAAVQVYANVASPKKAGMMLDFAYAMFLEDPERRWRWLVIAVLHARHRLADRTRALKYALALRERATGPAVAAWARDTSLAVLRDLGELRAAAVLARRMIESGKVSRAREVGDLERVLLHASRESGPR